MQKTFLGIAGLIVGGVAGFWIALWGVAFLAPRHTLLYGAHGLFGIPVGALAGCILGVRFADRITDRIRMGHPRLPLVLAVVLMVLFLIWFVLEFLGIT